MVFLSGVDNEFLHIWIAVHKVRESELNLQSGGKGSGRGGNFRENIGNVSLARRIKTDYNDFVAKDTDHETFFDRSIIIFKQSNSDTQYTTKIEKVTRIPVFIYKSKSSFRLRPNNTLKAWKPIEIPLKALFAFYNIHHDFKKSTIDECLALQVPNNVDVNFYLLDKNKAYWAKQLPGFRESGNRIISIATHANKFYWLPSSNLITQRLYCQKLPGKCLYWTDDKYDLEKHERICTDESIIRAKQVN